MVILSLRRTPWNQVGLKFLGHNIQQFLPGVEVPSIRVAGRGRQCIDSTEGRFSQFNLVYPGLSLRDYWPFFGILKEKSGSLGPSVRCGQGLERSSFCEVISGVVRRAYITPRALVCQLLNLSDSVPHENSEATGLRIQSLEDRGRDCPQGNRLDM